jgi:acyl-CoA reductase-like NAD-dependent aldehyde dehydrogenase
MAPPPTVLPSEVNFFGAGGTKIGAAVMEAAAKNLTPVTLELGGKSPVLVGRTADIGDVARRVMKAKTFNAGQICLAPDYVLLPKGSEEAITYVRNHPSPLALYYFGNDVAEERLVLDGTTSGGVTINDCISHGSTDSLPFGGIGPSGNSRRVPQFLCSG